MKVILTIAGNSYKLVPTDNDKNSCKECDLHNLCLDKNVQPCLDFTDKNFHFKKI